MRHFYFYIVNLSMLKVKSRFVSFTPFFIFASLKQLSSTTVKLVSCCHGQKTKTLNICVIFCIHTCTTTRSEQQTHKQRNTAHKENLVVTVKAEGLQVPWCSWSCKDCPMLKDEPNGWQRGKICGGQISAVK